MAYWQSHLVYQLAVAVAQGRLSLQVALAQARALPDLREADLQCLDA